MQKDTWPSRIALFYRYAKWRLPVLVLIISVSGILEALGIATVLPLLNIAFDKNPNDPISQAIVQAIHWIGIQPSLAHLLTLLMAIFILRAVAMFGYLYFAGRLILIVKRNTQITIINKISDMGYPYYTENTTGRFTNTLVTEIDRFASALRAFTKMSVSFFHAVFYIPAALILNSALTGILISVGAVSFFLLRYLTRNTSRLSLDVTGLNTIIQSSLIQFVQNFPYLKATASIDPLKSQVIKNIVMLIKKHCKIIFNLHLLTAMKEPIAIVTLAGFTYYQVVLKGGNMAAVMVLSLLLYRLMIQFLTLPAEYQNFNSSVGGLHAVQKITDELDKNKERMQAQRLVQVKGDIEFHNVSYCIGEQSILENINLIIIANETIGIVGESGAGKTTFFYLLTGLIRPTGGYITIDGVNYADFDLNDLRRKIGYVTQEPVVLNDTVANNIAFWRCDPCEGTCLHRIERAAKSAKCSEFIANMPKGFESLLGERGINLSGGQRQRIAIARELFKEPRILIFDEATSSLDAESERFVQQQIDGMKGERTIFIIAHRISTVRNCDRIYVFSNGQLIQHGGFQEMYKDDGSLFKNMCVQQGII